MLHCSFFPSSLAALESHEGEEKEKLTKDVSPKPSTLAVVDELQEKELSAASLPKQNSVSNCGDSVQVHVAAEVHGAQHKGTRWVRSE